MIQCCRITAVIKDRLLLNARKSDFRSSFNLSWNLFCDIFVPKYSRCQGKIFKNVLLFCCFVNTLTEVEKSVVLFLLRDVCKELIGSILLSWHVNQFKLFSIRIFQPSKLFSPSQLFWKCLNNIYQRTSFQLLYSIF